MDGITALLKGRNKELVESAEKVLTKLKKEVEEKGLVCILPGHLPGN